MWPVNFSCAVCMAFPTILAPLSCTIFRQLSCLSSHIFITAAQCSLYGGVLYVWGQRTQLDFETTAVKQGGVA